MGLEVLGVPFVEVAVWVNGWVSGSFLEEKRKIQDEKLGMHAPFLRELPAQTFH